MNSLNRECDRLWVGFIFLLGIVATLRSSSVSLIRYDTIWILPFEPAKVCNGMIDGQGHRCILPVVRTTLAAGLIKTISTFRYGF